MGKPVLPDLQSLYQAGINPKTGLPLKYTDKRQKVALKSSIKHMLRCVDEQNAINRYVWYNLPLDISSQELERLLYYKGQLCFFYDDTLEKFYVMPYALDGTIDGYGRYNTVHPVPMTSGTDDKNGKALAQYFADKKLKCVYAKKLITDVKPEDWTQCCVLIHDYSKQLAQTVTPRQELNDGLLDAMADCIPFMHTSLMLGTGVRGMRISDADQAYAEVQKANDAMEECALTGKPLIPITANIEFQDLTNGQVTKSEEYMLAMQSLDNFRLSTMGLQNGGLFEKRAHELQTEADLNGGQVGLIMQDGLSIRQRFCQIVNSIWGTSIWCEPAENIAQADLNGDGLMYDRDTTGEHTGVDTQETTAEADENE